MFKEPFKRSLTIVAYAYMFKEPLQHMLSCLRSRLTIIPYLYMFKEPFKQSLTIIAYVYIFKDRTYHLTMVKVDIRRFDTNR